MWLGSYAAWYCKWYRISRVEFSSLILSACSSIHVMLVGVDINWLNEEVMLSEPISSICFFLGLFIYLHICTFNTWNIVETSVYFHILSPRKILQILALK